MDVERAVEKAEVVIEGERHRGNRHRHDRPRRRGDLPDVDEQRVDRGDQDHPEDQFLVEPRAHADRQLRADIEPFTMLKAFLGLVLNWFQSKPMLAEMMPAVLVSSLGIWFLRRSR